MKVEVSIPQILMDLEQITYEMGMNEICTNTPSVSGWKHVLACAGHNGLCLCVRNGHLLCSRDDVE